MLRKTLTAAALLAFASPALADTGWHVSVDWLYGERKEADIPGFVDIPRVRAQGFALSGGYRFIDYFGVEARVGTVNSKTATITVVGEPIPVKLSTDYFVSAFLKGILPLQPNRINAYALVGATSVRGRATFIGFEDLTETETNTGFSYGVGFEFIASPRWGAKLEGTRYYDKDGVSLDAIHLGAIWRF